MQRKSRLQAWKLPGEAVSVNAKQNLSGMTAADQEFLPEEAETQDRDVSPVKAGDCVD